MTGAAGAGADAGAGSPLSPRAAGDAPTLESLIRATPRCHLTPFSFFVSWQGVLTLAYRCVVEPVLMKEGGRDSLLSLIHEAHVSSPNPFPHNPHPTPHHTGASRPP
jgi:hypothetical protein